MNTERKDRFKPGGFSPGFGEICNNCWAMSPVLQHLGLPGACTTSPKVYTRVFQYKPQGKPWEIRIQEDCDKYSPR